MAKKILVGALVLLLVLVTVAFFVVRSQLEPEKLRGHLLALASRYYTGKIEVDSVGISGFRTVEIRGVRLSSSDGKQLFVSLGAFAVEIDLWSLLGDAPRVQRVILQKPMIDVITDAQGRPAILAYVRTEADGGAREGATAPKADGGGKELALSVERIAVEEGLLRYSPATGPLPVPAEIRDLAVELALQGKDLRIRSVSALLPGGVTLDAEGAVKLLSPPVLDGVKIRLRGEAGKLVALAPKLDALSSISGDLEVDLGMDGPVTGVPASTLRLRLADWKVAMTGLPPLRADEVLVEATANAQELKITRVAGDVARARLSGGGSIALDGMRPADLKIGLDARLQDFVSFLPKEGPLKGLDGNLKIELAAKGARGRLNPSARIRGEKIRLALANGLRPLVDEIDGLLEHQSGTIHLRNLSVRVAEGTVKGTGHHRAGSSDMGLELRFAGLKPWKTLEPVLAPYGFGKAIEDVILRTATLSVTGERAELGDLQAGLGSSRLQGRLVLVRKGSDFVHEKSSATVELDARDLFAVLAVAKEHRLEGTARLTARIDGPLLDPALEGPLTADRLVYSYGSGGLFRSELRDVTARVTYRALVARVLDLKAAIFGGNLEGEGKVDLTGTPMTYDFDVKSVRVAANRLVSDLGGEAAAPYAKAVGGSMALVCRGKGAGTELAKLDADGSFAVEGLKIDGIPVLKSAAELLDMPVLAKLEAPSVKTIFKIANGALALNLEQSDLAKGIRALGGTVRIGADSGLDGGIRLELPEELMRASDRVGEKVKTFLAGHPEAAKLGLTPDAVIKGLKLDEKPVLELLVNGSLTAPVMKNNAKQLAAKVLTGLEKDLPKRIESLVKNALEERARNVAKEKTQALQNKLLDKVNPGAAEAIKGLTGGSSRGGGLKGVLGGLLGGSEPAKATPTTTGAPAAPAAANPADALGGLLKKKAGGFLGGLLGGGREDPAPAPAPTPPPTPPPTPSPAPMTPPSSAPASVVATGA